MDVSSIALSQASNQMNTAVSALKQAAQSEQEIVDMLIKNTSSSRGQNLDISI
jgi:hypothetical protein